MHKTKVLMWEKPPHTMTPEERRKHFSSHSGIPGTYVPRMPEEDIKKWKATLVETKTGHLQVEVRKDAALFIISLGGGYKHRGYGPDALRGYNTLGKNIHIAVSGALQWTWQDMEEFQLAIAEARSLLEELEAEPKPKAAINEQGK